MKKLAVDMFRYVKYPLVYIKVMRKCIFCVRIYTINFMLASI